MEAATDEVDQSDKGKRGSREDDDLDELKPEGITLGEVQACSELVADAAKQVGAALQHWHLHSSHHRQQPHRSVSRHTWHAARVPIGRWHCIPGCLQSNFVGLSSTPSLLHVRHASHSSDLAGSVNCLMAMLVSAWDCLLQMVEAAIEMGQQCSKPPTLLVLTGGGGMIPQLVKGIK